MKVQLSHAPNPDIRGGYWVLYPRPRSKKVKVADFVEASALCSEYIDIYELGGGNWTGGKIYDDNNKPIGYVSYNGRVWDTEGKEIVTA